MAVGVPMAMVGKQILVLAQILAQIIRYYSNKTFLHSVHPYCLLDNTYSTLNI